MAATEKRKRIIDRERQWRKVDAGHYVSPRGRFQGVRDGDGWTVVDTTGDLPVEFFPRWKDARAYTDAIEFAAAPIELVEDETHDEFHHFYRVKAIRRLSATEWVNVFEVVANRGGVQVQAGRPYSIEESEALATAIRLAAHHAAGMTEGR